MVTEDGDFEVVFKRVEDLSEFCTILLTPEELEEYKNIRALGDIVRDIQTPRLTSFSST